MRILMLTGGTNGDVRPLIALGKGLKNAGHEICLVSYDMFEAPVQKHGLEFASFQFDIIQAMQSDAGRAVMKCGDNSWCAYLNMSKVMIPGMYRLCDSAWAASQTADAIICSSFGGHFGPSIARSRGIPYATAFFQPHFSSGNFAHFLSPGILHQHKFGSWVNRASHKAGDFLLWFPYRKIMNKWCRERLNSPWSSFTQYRQQLHPSLCPYSPSVVPKPRDWGEDLEITGYWFLDEADEWQPPGELLEFLEAGSPPVTIGFGSMGATQDMIKIAVEALARTKQRGILLKGWSDLNLINLPDNIYAADEIPHDWIFPKSALVVHHGGAGSTAAGLRAGIPSILIPFMTDQFFWAQRVVELGVGPAAIPRIKLSADKLAASIGEAVTNKEIQQRATAIGESIRREDGIGYATKIINQWFTHRRR